MSALVHFLISFHNCNHSLVTAVPVTLFRDSMLRCTRSKLARPVWKLKTRKIETTKTKQTQRRRLTAEFGKRSECAFSFINHPYSKTWATHTVSKLASANSLVHPNLIVLKCSNFIPKNSSLQQIRLQICIAHTFCYYHNQYGDQARNCKFPCPFINSSWPPNDRLRTLMALDDAEVTFINFFRDVESH